MEVTVQAIAFDKKQYGLLKYESVNINTKQITFWYKKNEEYVVKLSCGSLLRVKDLEKVIDEESLKSLGRFGFTG